MREGSGKVYAVQREGRDMDVQWRRRPGVVVGALNVCLVCCRLEVVSIGLKRSLQMNNSQSVSRKGRLPKSRRVAQKLAPLVVALGMALPVSRSEEHTSELQSLMRNSYAVFCLKKKKQQQNSQH